MAEKEKNQERAFFDTLFKSKEEKKTKKKKKKKPSIAEQINFGGQYR